MDVQSLSDKELSDVNRQVADEATRRSILTSTAGSVDSILSAYLEAQGVKPGGEWTRPSSALDAYPAGWTVTHAGETWESATAGNISEPGADASWLRKDAS